MFDCWVGDDDDDPASADVCAALKAFSARARVFFIRGNHDFMAGAGFERRAGCAVLPAEHVIVCGGQTVLLMHGDSLCADDRAYQRYRRLVHNGLSRRLLARLGLKTRRRIAAWMMRNNRVFNVNKPAGIMDVNQDAVRARMRKHRASLLIHGHTHRRAEHVVDLGGGDTGRRVVLGNWGRDGGDGAVGNAFMLDNGETRWLSLPG